MRKIKRPESFPDIPVTLVLILVFATITLALVVVLTGGMHKAPVFSILIFLSVIMGLLGFGFEILDNMGF